MKINPQLNKWAYLGTTTGTNYITLPEEFNELMIYVKINNNSNVTIPILILKAYLTNTEQGFNGGYFAVNGMSAYTRVGATTTQAHLLQSYLNGNPGTGSVATYYYK